MIGMSSTATMEPHVETINTAPVHQAQAMALAQGEPQQQNRGVFEELKENQEKVLEQVRSDQQQLQQKLEETIYKELGRMTSAQDNQVKERDLMRTEMQEEMDHVIDVIHATNSKIMDSNTGNVQQLASTMEELNRTIKAQQEQFHSAMQGMSKVIADTLINITNQPKQTTMLAGEDNQTSTHPTVSRNATIINQRKTKPTKLKLSSSSSEESSFELESASEGEYAPQVIPRARSSHSSQQGGHKSNIPPFTGRETWKVWFTRFKDIAKRQGWDDDEKLDILLPKLQGEAGSFVYDQLSSKVRNNYQLLKKELKNRFRQVENPKTFSAVFAARRQKANESVENFAADLKKIYDKAYARRDPRTREEDLLRKFLDGLQDTKAAFHVEFVKDPKNIDTAVDEIINFQEVHKKQNRAMRRIGHDNLSSDEEYNHTIARTAGRPIKNSTNSFDAKTAPRQDLETKVAELTKQLDDLRKMQTPNANPALNQRYPYERPFNSSRPQASRPWPGELRCYNCQQVGHMQRECPFFLGGATLLPREIEDNQKKREDQPKTSGN